MHCGGVLYFSFITYALQDDDNARLCLSHQTADAAFGCVHGPTSETRARVKKKTKTGYP